MKVIFPAAAILAASFSFSAVASEVLSAEVKSPALGRALTYNVYLPTGYAENTNVRYPVMYLLHGNGGNRNDWHVKGRCKARSMNWLRRARFRQQSSSCLMPIPTGMWI
nr:alpha/beta hydrolase-fold protein [Comamonas jiangduensis]